MFTGSDYILTVVCDRSPETSDEDWETWVARARVGALAGPSPGAHRCVASFLLRQRSQPRQARDELLTRWTALVTPSESTLRRCVGVVTTPEVPLETAVGWCQTALHTELLWTRRAYEALASGAPALWTHCDHLTIESEQHVHELAATQVAWNKLPRRTQQTDMVGRQRERRLLGSLLRTLANGTGRPRPILLIGPAGIGKSTLIADASRQAHELGIRELRTHCVDYAQLRHEEPIGRLVAALLTHGRSPLPEPELRAAASRLCREVDRESSVPLLLDCIGAPLEDADRRFLSRFTSTGLRDARTQLLLRCVQEQAAQQPLMLLFEDLHWASEELLHLVESLADMASRRSMFILATGRPEPDILGANPRLREALSQVPIGPLSSQDARALAQRLSEQRQKPWQVQAGDFLHPAAIEHCLFRAQGNPLYISQLLRLDSLEAGFIQSSPSLDELLVQRIAQLDAPARRLLEVAACIGFYFDSARSLALTETGPATLHQLEKAELLMRVGEHYRFAHALIRDAVLHSLPAERRAGIQLTLADGESDPAIRAERWADAGDPRAFQAFLNLSIQRRLTYQWYPALAALERAADLARDPVEHARAALLRGEIFEEQGEGLRSLNCFHGAVATLLAHGLSEADPLVLRARLGILAAHRLLGRLDEAEQCIHALQRQLDAPGRRARLPLASARLDYLRGAIAFSRGQLALCQSAHTAALRTLEDPSDDLRQHRIYAQVLSGLGDALYAQGAFAEAREAMGRCVELARTKQLGRIEVSTLHMLGIVSAYAGEPAKGVRLARSSWMQACEVGDARAMLFSELNVGLTLYWNGQALEALESCYGGLERAEWIGSSVLMGMARSFTGHIRLAGGDLEQASLDSLRALEHIQHGGERLYGGVCYGLALGLAAGEAASDGATRWFDAGCALLADSVVSHNYMYFALGAVPWAMARGDADRLWQVLNLLRDFFSAEVHRCPEGSVSDLLTWVELHLDSLQGHSLEANSDRLQRVNRQPMLRQRLGLLGRTS